MASAARLKLKAATKQRNKQDKSGIAFHIALLGFKHQVQRLI